MVGSDTDGMGPYAWIYKLLNQLRFSWNSPQHKGNKQEKVDWKKTRNQCSLSLRKPAQIQSNLNSSNTNGSFTMANSNSFLNPYEILPIAQKKIYI